MLEHVLLLRQRVLMIHIGHWRAVVSPLPIAALSIPAVWPGLSSQLL
jgi:hypothetical protein